MKYSVLSRLLKTEVTAMAYSRTKWIDKATGTLTGAFGEWLKQRLSEEIGYGGHDWNKEVDTLLRQIRNLFVVVKTKSNFNKRAAFSESCTDVDLAGCYLYAKKELKTHPLTKDKKLKLDKTTLDLEKEFAAMLSKFLRDDIKNL